MWFKRDAYPLHLLVRPIPKYLSIIINLIIFCFKMPVRNKLAHINVYKLNETYDNLYELQQRLGIKDEYLLSTSRDSIKDEEYNLSLLKLLEASKQTRENLITWYLGQTLVELNVTISLLTAKIKFIEYKLGRCEGLDLHQACSLSLVNFCNILSDMTVLNVKPDERKTLHKVSKEVNVPVWLSHYRNQICHVPSEAPCIAILVPLVIKSLAYMKDSFWSKLLEREKFDELRCRNLILSVSRFTNLISKNHHLEVKNDVELTKKQNKTLQEDIERCDKARKALRELLHQNPVQSVNLLANSLISNNPKDAKNFALLLEQVILTRSFERLVFRILSKVEENPLDINAFAWLRRAILIVSSTDRRTTKRVFKKMDICVSMKTVRLTDISAIKCCQIAYRLIELDHPNTGPLICKLRHKLMPILGKKRLGQLLKLTKIATSHMKTKFEKKL